MESRYELIESDKGMSELLAYLATRGDCRIALDMEGENNLHCYGIHVALIQLYDGARAFAVDVLSLRNRRQLAELMENPRLTKVMFDAANDLLAFQHALGIRPRPLLDLAVATQLLHMPGGLRALSDDGTSARSKNRFQKANWMRRPLTPPMLDYAISDVLPLLGIAERLLEELGRRGLRLEFERLNAERQDRVRAWDPLANYVRIPGYQRMSQEDRAFAKTLWYAREYYARSHNVPQELVASKLDLRRVIEQGLRDGADIARFLNAGRARGRVDPAQLSRLLKEARADAEARTDVEARDEARPRREPARAQKNPATDAGARKDAAGGA